MALVTSMLCFIKRSISSRKFFESEYRYANDDMRIMRKTYVDEFWNDNASDDGFYVYTDGFYTRMATMSSNLLPIQLDHYYLSTTMSAL